MPEIPNRPSRETELNADSPTVVGKSGLCLPRLGALGFCAMSLGLCFAGCSEVTPKGPWPHPEVPTVAKPKQQKDPCPQSGDTNSENAPVEKEESANKRGPDEDPESSKK